MTQKRLLALVLTVLGVLPSIASAAFCVSNDGNGEYYLSKTGSQKSSCDASETTFSLWYDKTTVASGTDPKDVYTYFQTAIDNGDLKKLILTTDVSFNDANWQELGATECIKDFKPLDVIGKDGADKIIITSRNSSGGNFHVGSFCYMGDGSSDTENYGFFRKLKNVQIDGFALDTIIVKNGTYVGALAGSVESSEIKNVDIGYVYVYGQNAGGLVGKASGNVKIEGVAAEVLKVKFEEVSLSSANQNLVNLGGVAAVIDETVEISKSSVDELDMDGSVTGYTCNNGGLVGYANVSSNGGFVPLHDNYVIGAIAEYDDNNIGYIAGKLEADEDFLLMNSMYYLYKKEALGGGYAESQFAIGSYSSVGTSVTVETVDGKYGEIASAVFKINETDDSFRSDYFAYQLNSGYNPGSYSGSGIWTRNPDSKIGGYPTFSTGTDKPIQMIRFTIRGDAYNKIPTDLRYEIEAYSNGNSNSDGEPVIYLLTSRESNVAADGSDASGVLTAARWQEIYEGLESLGFAWVSDGGAISSFTTTCEFDEGNGYRLTPPAYVLTFDINIDSKFYKNTFFTIDFLQEGVLSRKLSEHVDEPVLQEIGVFRTDSCFKGGWRTKKDGGEEVWDVRDLFEEDTFKKLEMITDAGGQRVVKLYANWGACQSEPWEMELVRENCNDCKVKLVQEDANGNRYEHPFESNGSKMVVAIPRVDDAYYFPVTVEAEETEEMKLVDKDPFDLWGSISHVAGPWNKANQPYSLPFSAFENTELYVRYKGLPTHVTFDENTTENVFYGSNWVEKGKFYLAIYEEDFPRIYRAGYCFDGWRLDKDDIDAPVFRTGVELNEVLDEMGGKDSVELFAAWNEFDFDGNTCEAKTITMVSDGNGTVALNMTLPDKSHKDYPLEAKYDIMYQISVPGIFDERDTMKFNIVQKPDDGFTLLRANLSTDGSSLGDYLKNLESSILKGTDLSDSMSLLYEGENIIVGLPFVKNVRYDFVLDFGLEKDTLDNTMFFASAEERYEFGPKDSLRLRELIPVIYDAGNEKFVSNWSLDESGEYRLYSPNLYDAATKYRKENKAIELVAKWEYGLPTNTSFDITGAKFENGSVNLVQVYNDQVIRHNMNESSVSLPQLDEKFVYAFKVEAVPGKGFVLNKPIEVFVEVKDDTSFTLKLNDGDMLVLTSLGRDASKRIQIKAEFDPIIEIAGGYREINEVELALSGKAVRYSVPSNMFDKGARARVSMRLLDVLGNVIADTLLYDGDEPPEVINWERFPLSVGRYEFKSEIVNGDDKTDFNRDFVVKNELAEACDGCWHMVGLSNVNLKNVEWGDAEFYWWDESRNFGRYWQYQEFSENDSPVEGRGYWFNTEMDQTLALKDSVPRPEDFIWELDSIYSGWNMVSNPYSWYIDAYALYMVEEDGAANKADTAAVKFWRWDAKAGAYEPVQYLAPHEAVWAQTSRKVKWEIPGMPCYVTVLDSEGNLVPAPGLKSTVSLFKESSAKESFTLRAVLADSKGRVDRWNTIGVGDQALMAEEPPQGMGDFVNLSVVEGKKALATSLKKRSDAGSYEWNMELKAADIRMGYLSFEGVDELKAKGLSLYVTVDGETTEVQEGKAMNVALGKDVKKANVYVAASPRKVASATLQGLKAVQVGRMLLVNFMADASLAGGMTRVELVSLQGRVMAAASAKILAGANTLNLEIPKSGVYMLRVKAGSRSVVGRVLVR